MRSHPHAGVLSNTDNVDGRARPDHREVLHIGHSRANVTEIEATSAGDSLRLSFPPAVERTTLVTLEVAADGMRYVRKLSSGSVSNATSAPFEALSGGGAVWALLTNTGDAEAEFVASVPWCDSQSVELARAQAARAHLCAGESVSVRFEVDVDDAEGGTFECEVALHSSVGEVLDTARVGVRATSVVVTGENGRIHCVHGQARVCQRAGWLALWLDAFELPMTLLADRCTLFTRARTQRAHRAETVARISAAPQTSAHTTQ